MIQGRQNGGEGIKPADQIRFCHADFKRRAFDGAGQAHDPAHALYQEIITRAVFVGAVITKARE